ncbi:Uncharacterized protein PHSC3_001954 [Chlamydiales bacterium STE3]|nr:Uncharacterized protein PHSC3_001954 [Chlamydiales bacterium STE3]
MKKIITFVLLIALNAGLLEGASDFSHKTLKKEKEASALSVESHFNQGMDCLERSDYAAAARQFQEVVCHFPGFTRFAESFYYLGMSYYHLGEYDFANEAFSNYLKNTNQPKYFEETLGFKYAIAEKFRHGAKRRVFGAKQLPKWASGNDLALEIYDEVIYSLPSHEYAALSLFAKATMLLQDQEWRESVEAYQTLIRRFPKHELTPEAYLGINRVYLEQCQREFQNPDLIALAQINLKRFSKDFPRDERVQQAERDLQAIKEVYAKGLYETGQYYERTSKPKASIIYYRSAISQFPETKIAEFCRARIEKLESSSNRKFCKPCIS